MGAAVTGDSVLSAVGALVALCVGKAEGCLDGWCDGCAVGCLDGWCDGCAVGFLVGLVGCDVERDVGCDVVDGAGVADAVGDAVGACDCGCFVVVGDADNGDAVVGASVMVGCDVETGAEEVGASEVGYAEGCALVGVPEVGRSVGARVVTGALLVGEPVVGEYVGTRTTHAVPVHMQPAFLLHVPEHCR